MSQNVHNQNYFINNYKLQNNDQKNILNEIQMQNQMLLN